MTPVDFRQVRFCLVALALLFASVAVDADVVPVAQCWRQVPTPDGQVSTAIYFGYSNSGSEVETIPVSLINFYSGVETDNVPITTFYPGFNGLASKVTIGPELSSGGPILFSWNLNSYVATINTTSPSQQCNETSATTFTIEIAGGNQEFDNDAVIGNVTQAAGISSQAVTTLMSEGELVVMITPPTEGNNQYDAVNALVTAFYDDDDLSFRAALNLSIDGNVMAARGSSTASDQPGSPLPPVADTPVTPTPITPTIIPLAHCWEPVPEESSSDIWMYFGYLSTYSTIQNIQPNPVSNHYVGAPDNSDSPPPVFYPGINGFTNRLRVPAGTPVEWILAGFGVLLDGSNVNQACNVVPDGNYLPATAAWSSGSHNESAEVAGTMAVSAVSHLPTDSVTASYADTETGFTGTFQLGSGNNISAYEAMYTVISDFHNSTGQLQILWAEAFGAPADSFASEGTDQDTVGSPSAPANGTTLEPVAHCWAPSSSGTVIAYFGYVSSYPTSVSYLKGSSNYIVGAQGYNVPTVFYSGYNGFTVAVTVSEANTEITWNLAGASVVLDLTNTEQQCVAQAPTAFVMNFAGNLLVNVDRSKSTPAIVQQVLDATALDDPDTISVDYWQDLGAFSVQVTINTPPTDNTQYIAVFQFISAFNNIQSSSLRVVMGATVNATAQSIYSAGTPADRYSNPGQTPPSSGFGSSEVAVLPTCWFYNSAAAVDVFFGYQGNQQLDISLESSFSFDIQEVPPTSFSPIVFKPGVQLFRAWTTAATGAKVTLTIGTNTGLIETADQTRKCDPDASSTVDLYFHQRLDSPPPLEPVLNWISISTGYPYDAIQGNWVFDDSRSDFTLRVVFKPYPAELPMLGATKLITGLHADHQQVVNISAAATSLIYAATAGVSDAPTPVAPTPVAPTPVAPTPVAPTPVAPTPVAPTPQDTTPVPNSMPLSPPPPRKGISGPVVFAIVVGVLLGVGILGGALFYFLRYQKGMCRPNIERRPLLAQDF